MLNTAWIKHLKSEPRILLKIFYTITIKEFINISLSREKCLLTSWMLRKFGDFFFLCTKIQLSNTLFKHFNMLAIWKQAFKAVNNYWKNLVGWLMKSINLFREIKFLPISVKTKFSIWKLSDRLIWSGGMLSTLFKEMVFVIKLHLISFISNWMKSLWMRRLFIFKNLMINISKMLIKLKSKF